jgi:hypothetical protein
LKASPEAYDIPNMLFARSGAIGFLAHLRSLRRYDEAEILHFALTSICLVNADAGQGGINPIMGSVPSRFVIEQKVNRVGDPAFLTFLF